MCHMNDALMKTEYNFKELNNINIKLHIKYTSTDVAYPEPAKLKIVVWLPIFTIIYIGATERKQY